MKQMKRIALLIIALLLMISVAAGAEDSWTCPQCGRTGNTGKFCGTCKHPAPEPVTVTEVPVDEAHFPDEIFRAYVQTLDLDQDGVLNTEEILAVTVVKCREKKISSLKGIEYLAALEKLDCTGNSLQELDVSANVRSSYLSCYDNEIASIDLSKNASLVFLNIFRNQLEELDLSNNANLTEVRASGNKLQRLDVSSNRKLITLMCNDNLLTSIDISQNKDLTALECKGNDLEKLDLSGNPRMERLRCDGNRISAINISACKNLIMAREHGQISATQSHVLQLYTLTERNDFMTPENFGTVRDLNCYVIEADSATEFILE